MGKMWLRLQDPSVGALALELHALDESLQSAKVINRRKSIGLHHVYVAVQDMCYN